MKRMVFRVILSITIPFILIMSLFVVISITSSTSALSTSINDMLLTSTDSWAREFEGFFREQLAIVKSYEAYIESTLTVEILGSDQSFLEYQQLCATVGVPILDGNQQTTLYTWYSPEYTDTLQMLSFRDLEHDGIVETKNDSSYTRDDIVEGDWKWFYLAEQNGLYITDPYYWEEFGTDIVSITASIDIENQTVDRLDSPGGSVHG